jgi:hypothetical protein
MQFMSLFPEPNLEFDSYLQGPVPTAVTSTTMALQTNSSPVIAVSSVGESVAVFCDNTRFFRRFPHLSLVTLTA